MLLMLLGNAGLVTVAASLIVAFAGPAESRQWWELFGLLVFGLLLIGLWSRTSGWIGRCAA